MVAEDFDPEVVDQPAKALFITHHWKNPSSTDMAMRYRLSSDVYPRIPVRISPVLIYVYAVVFFRVIVIEIDPGVVTDL